MPTRRAPEVWHKIGPRLNKEKIIWNHTDLKPPPSEELRTWSINKTIEQFLTVTSACCSWSRALPCTGHHTKNTFLHYSKLWISPTQVSTANSGNKKRVFRKQRVFRKEGLLYPFLYQATGPVPRGTGGRKTSAPSIIARGQVAPASPDCGLEREGWEGEALGSKPAHPSIFPCSKEVTLLANFLTTPYVMWHITLIPSIRPNYYFARLTQWTQDRLGKRGREAGRPVMKI